MSERYSKLKYAARLTFVAIGALILSLLGVPLTIFSTVLVYGQLKEALTGGDPFVGGKSVVFPLLFVASVWLLKMSTELWHKFRDLLAGQKAVTLIESPENPHEGQGPTQPTGADD